MNVHMVDSDSESDEMSNAPPDIADEKNLNLLPKKSGDLYKKQYSVFIQWCNEKKITEYNENVLLAFFSQKAEKYKSSTLWSTFSMLKATLIAKNNINIGSYPKLMAYLKRQNVGYKAKKSNVFTKSEINTFLLQAPDDTYLMCKVCLIFGLAGGCRRQELRDISIDNIEDRNDILLVKIPDAATGKWRIFAVTDKVCEGRSALEIYHKYVSLRPIYVTHKTFFISYRNGRCNNQVVGIHTFAKIPSIIAKYLNLPDTNNYTGHCFRKTAVSLANAGADIMTLKGQRGWRSSPVAERYVEDSPSNKLKMTNEILNDNKLISQNRWTVTQLEALIAQYKSYPVLYSNSHQDRDNVDLKNQYLSQIVQALQSARPGVTAVDVLSQWNNLIIKYMQAARLQLQGPTGTEEPHLWYFKKMDFLEQACLADVKVEVNADDQEIFESEMITEMHDLWENGAEEDPLESSSRVMVKEEGDSPPTKEFREDEDTRESFSWSDRASKDENDVFGEFVAAELKKIADERIRQDTLLEIHNVLHKALTKK